MNEKTHPKNLTDNLIKLLEKNHVQDMVLQVNEDCELVQYFSTHPNWAVTMEEDDIILFSHSPIEVITQPS